MSEFIMYLKVFFVLFNLSYFSNVTSTYYMEMKIIIYIYIYMGGWLSVMLESFLYSYLLLY